MSDDMMQYIEAHAEEIANVLRAYLVGTTEGAVPSAGNGQVARAPKAEERQPGQWWVEVGHAYTLGYDDRAKLSLRVWKKSRDTDEFLEFPVAWVREMDTGWPAAWIEKMQADGLRHDFKTPVYLVMQVATRTNRQGNYYVNCMKMTTKQEEAGL